MDNDDRKKIAEAFVKQSEQNKELAKKRREDIIFKICITLSALIILSVAVRCGIAIFSPSDAITYEEYMEQVNAERAEKLSNEIEGEWNKPTNSPVKADAAALDKISPAVELPSPEENQAVVFEQAPSNETAKEAPVTNATTGHTDSETVSAEAPTASTEAVQQVIQTKETEKQEQPNQSETQAQQPQSSQTKPAEPKPTHSAMPQEFDVRYVDGKKQVYMLGEWIEYSPGKPGQCDYLEVHPNGNLVGY